MKRHSIKIEQTIATIVADDKYLPIARKEIYKQRKDLENFIHTDPFFQITFEPYEYRDNAPEIVKRMCNATKKVNVGPMAAVAGAIAQLTVEAMITAGAPYAIMDNGGDIALKIDKPLMIGIYTGDSSIKDIGVRIKPSDDIYGVCTSSGTVGPSISLGNSDAVVAFAKDTILADAAATALGNMIVDDDKNNIEKTIEKFNIDSVDGFIVVTHSHMGIRGKVPKLIRAKVDYDLITKG